MARLIIVLIYAALSLSANPALALDDALRAELTEMREGTMRKLAFHSKPKPVGQVTYTGADGAEQSLADSNGRIRIVNFWATWCAPCRQEKPALDALQGTLGGADFEVIAIATGRNPPAAIKKFNSEVGIANLETHLDPKSQTARAMGVLGLPVSVILDRDGNEIARLSGGAEWDSANTRAILDRLIGAGS